MLTLAAPQRLSIGGQRAAPRVTDAISEVDANAVRFIEGVADCMNKTGVQTSKLRAAANVVARQKQQALRIREEDVPLASSLLHLGACLHMDVTSAGAACPTRACKICGVAQTMGKICPECRSELVEFFRTWNTTLFEKSRLYQHCIRPIMAWGAAVCMSCQRQATTMATELSTAVVSFVALDGHKAAMMRAPTRLGGLGFDPELQVSAVRDLAMSLSYQLERSVPGDGFDTLLSDLCKRRSRSLSTLPPQITAAISPLDFELHPSLVSWYSRRAVQRKTPEIVRYHAMIHIGRRSVADDTYAAGVLWCDSHGDNLRTGHIDLPAGTSSRLAPYIAAARALMRISEDYGLDNAAAANELRLDVYATVTDKAKGQMGLYVEQQPGWLRAAMNSPLATELERLRFCRFADPAMAVASPLSNCRGVDLQQHRTSVLPDIANSLRAPNLSPSDTSCRLWRVTCPTARTCHPGHQLGPVLAAKNLMWQWHMERMQDERTARASQVSLSVCEKSPYARRFDPSGTLHLDPKAGRFLECLRHLPDLKMPHCNFPGCPRSGTAAANRATALHIYQYHIPLADKQHDASTAQALSHGNQMEYHNAPWEQATLQSYLGIVPEESDAAQRVLRHANATHRVKIVKVILRSYVARLLAAAATAWGHSITPVRHSRCQHVPGGDEKLIATVLRFDLFEALPQLPWFSTSDGSFKHDARDTATHDVIGFAVCIFERVGNRAFLRLAHAKKESKVQGDPYASARGAESRGLQLVGDTLKAAVSNMHPALDGLRAYMATKQPWFYFSDALVIAQQLCGRAHTRLEVDRRLRDDTATRLTEAEKALLRTIHLGWVPRRHNREADKYADCNAPQHAVKWFLTGPPRST